MQLSQAGHFGAHFLSRPAAHDSSDSSNSIGILVCEPPEEGKKNNQ